MSMVSTHVVPAGAGRDGGLERVEVAHQQVDRGDAVRRHLLDVRRPVPAAEQPAMDLRDQRLDPAVQDLREAGVVRHLRDRDAGRAQAAAEPPVDRMCTPCAASAWASGTRPALSETEIRARAIGNGAHGGAHTAVRTRTPAARSGSESEQVQRAGDDRGLVVARGGALAACGAHGGAQGRVGDQAAQGRGERRRRWRAARAGRSRRRPPARAGPRMSVATTGRPVSMASITDIGRPSKWLGRAKMSAAARMAGMSVR